jgi:Ca2+-binding EF-hand superfamily protein
MRTNLLITPVAIGILFTGLLSAQSAGSQSSHWLRQMDRDRNGTVSKVEFLQFMGRTFDRLDTNRTGKLERNELRPLIGGRWDRIHTPPR